MYIVTQVRHVICMHAYMRLLESYGNDRKNKETVVDFIAQLIYRTLACFVRLIRYLRFPVFHCLILPGAAEE